MLGRPPVLPDYNEVMMALVLSPVRNVQPCLVKYIFYIISFIAQLYYLSNGDQSLNK